MDPTPAAAITEFLLGLAWSPAGRQPDNRFTLEGLACVPDADGAFEIRARRFEAAALHLASGPLVLEVGQLVLHELAAQLRIEGGTPRLLGLRAARAELSGVKVHGPLAVPDSAAAADASPWSLGPLAAAQGTLRARIVDAHLLFDADVTVPIRHGRVDFKDASVEHVGPDSRMGASRLGLYVDAPNGRSYLYQFPTAPIPGVTYERRGAMLGPWVTDRGRLELQPFGEWLLRQGWGGQMMGITEQARLLFDRTAVSGDVQLGDGSFAAPGLQAELAGAGAGRNAVRVHSDAVGRGLTLEMASTSVRAAVVQAAGTRLACAELEAALSLCVSVEGKQLRFAIELARATAAGLVLE
ncbi:MAG TPA: hypothetical protein VIL30_09210 [Ramlibacter sp.]|jgi:hypothetical protein